MNFKNTFDLDNGMNKWEAGFEPIKLNSVEVKPFIDTAIELLHLACELRSVKEPNTGFTDFNAKTLVWQDIIANCYSSYAQSLRFVAGTPVRGTERIKLPDAYWQAFDSVKG